MEDALVIAFAMLPIVVIGIVLAPLVGRVLTLDAEAKEPDDE